MRAHMVCPNVILLSIVLVALVHILLSPPNLAAQIVMEHIRA